MNYPLSNQSAATSFDIARITERENTGVHSISLTRIAVGYILSGTKYIHHNDHSYPIVEGGLFILDSGFHYEENIIGTNGRFEQISFFISPAILQQVIFGLNINYGLSFSSRHSCQRCSSRNFIIVESDRLLRSFFQGVDLSLRSTGLQHNDVGQRIKLNELIYLLLTSDEECVRRKVLRSADVDSGQFVNAIYENVFNDISIEALATLTNRSLTSFKKEFSRLFNASPHKWIIGQRLDRAKILLSSTSRTVSEIGAERAFSNISHFIKLFKHRFGETPAAFRRRHSVLNDDAHRVAVGE
jgi:AraC-like DNA-binding protein